MSSPGHAQEPASPARCGYRMPAEWEPHYGTWLSWPHNPDTWPGNLPEVEAFYLDLIRAIADDEKVLLNVPDATTQHTVAARLQQAGMTAGIDLLIIPTNDAWCRDYGPTILRRIAADSPLPPRLAINWEYNAWGGKYPPYDADNGAAARMAAAVKIPCVAGGMTLEGGAIDTNGQGWLLTTASCLLNSNRNPGISKELVEQRLRAMLGVQEILWLAGELTGDDTDGHIDNLVRFVDRKTVVCTVSEGDAGEQGTGLRENLQFLQGWRGRDGERLEVRPLPLPAPVSSQGKLLPASYANFYLTNRSVLVPQYGCPQDRAACELLADCFPSRRVVGIDCTYAIRGLGAIHCLTQQLPA